MSVCIHEKHQMPSHVINLNSRQNEDSVSAYVEYGNGLNEKKDSERGVKVLLLCGENPST